MAQHVSVPRNERVLLCSVRIASGRRRRKTHTRARVAPPRTLVIASSHGSTNPSSLSSMSTGYGVQSSLGGGTTRTAVFLSDAHIQANPVWRRVSRRRPSSRRARHGGAHTAAYLPAHGLRDLCLKILDAHAGIRVDLDVVEFLSSSERGRSRRAARGGRCQSRNPFSYPRVSDGNRPATTVPRASRSRPIPAAARARVSRTSVTVLMDVLQYSDHLSFWMRGRTWTFIPTPVLTGAAEAERRRTETEDDRRRRQRQCRAHAPSV